MYKRQDRNSGDYFSGLTDEELLSRNAAKLASKFCEKGLRYDLTVPFARYVVCLLYTSTGYYNDMEKGSYITYDADWFWQSPYQK